MASRALKLKFPRTTHFFNLGSATRDDLRLSKEEAVAMLSKCAASGLRITAEEKVDGANLGLMWDANSSKIVAQNRSTRFDPASSADTPLQFKQLNAWISSHRSRLSRILDGGNRIVYGEWMALKHCIHYTRLPDYWLAFDILDLKQGMYLSRANFKKELENANGASDEYEPLLFAIEEVELEDSITVEGLKDTCLKTQSTYYDGPVEGLYLRWDKGDWLEHRAKLVRPGFQQAIDEAGHWSKQVPVKNIVDFNKQQWF